MRRPSHRSRRNRRSMRSAARSMRVTNEEILGDLLYPAPASRVNPAGRKAHR